LSCGQLEQRDAKRVDICSRILFLTRELFGRHICQRTHDRARLGQPARHRVASLEQRETEVQDLRPPLRRQRNIPRL
jgi:hypothetical protein